MSIEEKYNIQYFNNKRYYKFDLTAEILVLENTIPYFFEYNGKRIYESAWNRLTVKILEMLDDINPIPNETLLALEYDWSKIQVFSATKRTNFLQFKDLYVNTNHTATHAGMSIRFLLKTYGVDPGECVFYIRRHPIAEPVEAREYYRKQTEDAFRQFLILKGKNDKSCNNIIGNFSTINKFLAHGSTGFNDFFLFDDYTYFCSYKQKTVEYVQKKYYGTKYQTATEKGLKYLEEFYKHRDFYLKVGELHTAENLAKLVIEEIESLFRSLNTNIISASKLYARMSMLHSEELESLGELNNLIDFYTLIELLLAKKYIFKKPFISNDPGASLSNDDILMNYAFSLEKFNLKIIKDYANKMQLNPPTNYVEFMESCSEYYVQVDADKMMSKENIEIDTEIIEKIRKEVAYYINSFGPINTSVYTGYSSLPVIERGWNKYLLVGVVRTYLNDVFDVSSTGGKYKHTDYVINLR